MTDGSILYMQLFVMMAIFSPFGILGAGLSFYISGGLTRPAYRFIAKLISVILGLLFIAAAVLAARTFL